MAAIPRLLSGTYSAHNFAALGSNPKHNIYNYFNRESWNWYYNLSLEREKNENKQKETGFGP